MGNEKVQQKLNILADAAKPDVSSVSSGSSRRNFIEWLFLSSGIIKNPGYTMDRMVQVARKLRQQECYNGYIQLKAIPCATGNLLFTTSKR